MKTHRSWLTFQVVRLLAVALMMTATFAGGLRSAAAQDGESGVEDNTYTGPSYGWSVEWDEDIWEVAEEEQRGRFRLPGIANTRWREPSRLHPVLGHRHPI